MVEPIRFHLDENCPGALADGLRAHGLDVTSTPDAQLLSADDGEHVAYGLRTARVIVTYDEDFLRMHAAGVEHAGIAYCPSRRRSIGELIRRLQLIAAVLTPEEMKNRLEYI